MSIEACVYPILITSVIVALGTFVVVEEGHVGVFQRGGALMPGVQQPGLGFKLPFITTFYQVQTQVQTDEVKNVPCGTSGGVVIHFDKIEVVNRLRKEHVWNTIKNYTINYDKTWIFDKIHHEINQLCSAKTLQQVYITFFDQLDELLQNALQQGCQSWAPGIEIISVRTTKPRIPTNVMSNYLDMELEKTKLLNAEQEQKMSEKSNSSSIHYKPFQLIPSFIQPIAHSALFSMSNNAGTLLEKRLRMMTSETDNKILALKHENNKVLLELDREINQLQNKMTTETKSTERKVSALQSDYKQKLNTLKKSAKYSTYDFQEELMKVSKQFYVKNLSELNQGLFSK